MKYATIGVEDQSAVVNDAKANRIYVNNIAWVIT